ncbi:MAG: M20/M25/M40 family metallo-hydrolase [Alphaproteobacteria bacterium]|nr:M20/M25/M40 family metallo-hydrolase [Alphaproteobacteria bacterium]
MSDVRTGLLKQAEDSRDRVIGFLGDLVRAQRDGEAAVQALVSARLAEIGCTIEDLAYNPVGMMLKDEFASEHAIHAGERVSVIGRFPGANGGRSLIMFAHPDGEPIARTEEWAHDPFAAEIDGGRMYGWGVADDLMGVAAGVCALDIIAASKTRLNGDVIMASTPSKRHARGVTAVLNNGYSADAALYLHPAESGVGLREIKALASGQLVFRIKVTGRRPDTTEPGHAAFAHLAINPIDKAIVLHQALTALGDARAKRVHHQTLDAAVGRSTNVMVSAIQSGFDRSLTQMSPVCEIAGAISYPPTEKLLDVQAEVDAAIKEAIAADPWMKDNPPDIIWLSGVTGTEIKTDHPLYQTVSRAITDVTGTEPAVNPMHTSSDIRVPLVQKGIPTVGIGSLGGNLAQNGLCDEWVDVDDFVRLVQTTAVVIADWCGTA